MKKPIKNKIQRIYLIKRIMKKIIVLSLVFIFSQTSFAQFSSSNYTIRLTRAKFKQNYAASQKFNTDLNENLSNSFNIGHHSNIIIKPVINTGKAHLIEGMDIKATGNPQLEFIIQEKYSNKDDIFIYKKQITTKNISSMGDQLVALFINDAKAHDDLTQFINNFINLSFNEGCIKQFEKIDNLVQEQKYEDAIRLVSNLIPSPCKSKAKSIQSELIKKYSETICKSKIQQASIMVNSGVSFQMKRAIPLLLSISPTAPCAKEAIELANKIGSKMDNTQQISADIKRYQSSTNAEWQKLFLMNLIQN